MSIILTDKSIKAYRENPMGLAYDSGYSQGFNDRSWDSRNPRVFSKDDCPSYRRGYRRGWAVASSHYKNEEGVFDDSISEEQRNYWIDEELKIILDWENKNADCDDEHCVSDEDAKASWLEVVECMARIGKKGKHPSPPDAIRFGDMC